jgi:hypothetical protein
MRRAVVLLVLAASVRAGSEVPPGRWQSADDFHGDAAWTALQARHPGPWSVWTDLATGAPSLVAGAPIPAGTAVRADEAGIARARAFLDELREVLRVDDPSAFALERAVAVTNPHGQELTFINLKQTWRGLDVWHQSEGGEREKLALVKLRFKGTDLVLFGSDATPALGVPDEVRLQEGEAAHRAVGLVGTTALASVEARSYVSVRGNRAFLARDVEVRTEGPEHLWRYIFDAHTGALVERRDALRRVDVVGDVQMGCLDYPGGTFAMRPGASLRVATQTSPVYSAYARTDGSFRITYPGTLGLFIEGRLLGEWAAVQDTSGNGDLFFVRSATPGQPAPVRMNPSNVAEAENAETAGYYWTTRTHDELKAHWTGFTGLASLPVRVNLVNTCNAYWNGTSINFFISGMGCNNSAYSDVIAHEYGHAFHDWWHGSTDPGGFSEGIGDHVAYMLTGSRAVGRNFHQNGSPVRDYRPGGGSSLRQWPCTGCEVHRRGEVWAGFTFDLHDALIARLGSLPGYVHWGRITLAMYAANPADEVEALAHVYLMDDPDANLANGTTVCTDITKAAQRHALPIPVILPSSCGNDPLPPAPEYRTPVPVNELNGAAYDSDPCLDDAQLNVWWTSNRAGGLGANDIWTASRPNLAAAWGTPVNVAAVNSSAGEFGVEVRGDGLEMFIVSNRAGGSGGWDLWRSTRSSPTGAWSAPTALTALNTASHEVDPSIRSDGLELFFSSDRVSAVFNNYSASRSNPSSTAWTGVINVANTGTDDGAPAIAPDGMTLFTAVPLSGRYSFRKYLRSAPSPSFPFSLWRLANELNSTSADNLDGDVTADDFSFYFARIGSLGPSATIYRADRVHPRMVGPTSGWPSSIVRLSLRRDPGDFGWIVLGVDPLPATPVAGVSGPLLILPLVVVAQGVHGVNGLVTWTAVVPNAPGVTVYLQGLSQDPQGQLYLSDRLAFVHTP